MKFAIQSHPQAVYPQTIKESKLCSASCKFYQQEDSVLSLEIQHVTALDPDTPELGEMSDSEVDE